MINARMKEILGLVNDEIKISGYKDKLNLGVVLTGGGAQLKDISNLAEFVLSCEAKIGMPDPHLGTGLVDEVKSPMFATCIGLVLKGCSDLDPIPAENHMKPNGEKRKSPSGGSVFKNLFVNFKDWMKDDKAMGDYER